MSNLIRSRKAVTTAQSSPPLAQPAAATAPAQMDHLLVGLRVSHAPVSSASSVAQPVSARRRHRPPSTTDTTSTSATSASGSQPAKNTRGLSLIEDGECCLGDQQSYQHCIRRVASGCTNGGPA